ncbi:MAG: hypothetical protein QN187_07645 [Armatimonadota bacterium]|nr:hypothetical protein [Armatimonadota bacterium]MDR7518851.1 hypothetical protein [Armatimonadota bacterium]MDR7549080.1 hypothetical protein [Armatimonadota bacterium]
MLVDRIELVESQGGIELRACVRSAHLQEPFLLWYRFPRETRPHLDAENGDPFLAAMLPLAMRTGQPVRVGAAVSPKLLRAVETIQAIFRSWNRRLSPVAVEASARSEGPTQATTTGRNVLFFSLGVDSFYTLLKNLAQHPRDSETITDLLIVNGFDVALEGPNSALFPSIRETSARVARELGCRVIAVATNVRHLSRRLLPWSLYHGAAMASVALALDPMISKAYIAGGNTYARLHPWGTHPVLDPLWSTETLTVVHDGCENTRIEKVRFITRWPVVLETLRVCYENPDGAYNCGQCEKCVRTMLCLHAVGKLGACATLPPALDLRRLERLVLDSHLLRTRYEEILGGLGTSSTDLAVRRILQARILQGLRIEMQRAEQSADQAEPATAASDTGGGST